MGRSSGGSDWRGDTNTSTATRVKMDTSLTWMKGTVLCWLMVGAAISLPNIRTARQALEGFPDGLPALTPKGVKLSLDQILNAAGDLVMNPIQARLVSTIPSSTRCRRPALTAAPRITPGSTRTPRLAVSLSTCAPLPESPRRSCVQTEPSSTSSTSSVIGGTTLTVTSNLPSTVLTSCSTRNRTNQTARLSSAKMTNGFAQVWNPPLCS